MTPAIASMLDGARMRAGLTADELWVRYYAVGGAASPDLLAGHLSGATEPSPAEFDVITQAINDHLIGSGNRRPAPYWDELSASPAPPGPL